MANILAFTIIEWDIIFALGVVILVCLSIVAASLSGPKEKEAGVTGPSEAGFKALQEFHVLVDAMKEAGEATPEDCERMRSLIEEAKSGGISDMELARMTLLMNQLCD